MTVGSQTDKNLTFGPMGPRWEGRRCDKSIGRPSELFGNFLSGVTLNHSSAITLFGATVLKLITLITLNLRFVAQ